MTARRRQEAPPGYNGGLVTRRRKLALLSALYLAQGLPFGFQANALPVYLREQGVSLVNVGLLGALSAPWLLKALWAPLVDRYGSARLGRRRAWLVPLQALLALTCGLTAAVHEHLPSLLGCLFALNLLAATQDIAVDGLAVDLLETEDLGPGNAAQVCGYKLGMIAGGGTLVWASGRLGWGWTGVFLAMGALTALVLVAVLLWREPPPTGRTHAPPTSLRDVLRALRLAASSRPGLWLLAFIGSYRAGESLVDAMFKPFLVDVGFTREQITLWVGTYGMVASFAGSLLGGALAARGRLWRVVFWATLLRCLPLAAQTWLAGLSHAGGLEPWHVIVVTSAEHLASGVLTTALFAFMMSRVDRAIGASHYTLLASVEVLGKSPGAWASGALAQALGYAPLFALGTLASLVLLAPLLALRDAPAPVPAAGAAA